MIQRNDQPPVPTRTSQWITPAYAPAPVPSKYSLAQQKQWIESWIEEYPAVALGSALCLGLCVGWLIKRR